MPLSVQTVPAVARCPDDSLRVGSTADLLRSCESARSIRLSAYVLSEGPVADALCAAGDRGADVHVIVDAAPYDPSGRLTEQNSGMLSRLRSHGVTTEAVAGRDKLPGWHMKAAVIDAREAFLDDRNWPDDGRDTIVVTRDPDDVAAVAAALEHRAYAGARVQTTKDAADADEAELIAHAASDAIAVESESFGGSHVSKALRERASAGAQVRLLVSERDESPRQAAIVRGLEDLGVEVRAGRDDEKIAVCTDEVWVGSANASFWPPELPDWGIRSRNASVVETVRQRFERNWSAAHPYAFRALATA